MQTILDKNTRQPIGNSFLQRSEPAAIQPGQLGSYSFKRRYGIRYAYLTGAMYRGIASWELVVDIGRAGLLGFLGTGGMSLTEIADSIALIKDALKPHQVYGMNLICNLNKPQTEMDTVELFIREGITCVEAAAFMRITTALAYYRISGLERNADGVVECRNKIVAKASRPEVARAFLNPPPAAEVERLLRAGKITAEQAEMAGEIPVSHDICIESDSGGHTDQGVAAVLFPSFQTIRQEIEQTHRYREPIHLGLAGGVGSPEAAAAYFMMGADFILTGSINQCTVEAGTSDRVKDLLQAIDVQDTDYAPAGDMFELGARVQVLKKGVLFPVRANKLYMLYTHYDSLADIPEKITAQLESRYFKKSLAQIWDEVVAYHLSKGQRETLEKAEVSAKHKMALVFKWYFSYSARLAFSGDGEHQVDFQVHTGPALGAFNQWVKGSTLASWRNRHVGQIAEYLMTETAELFNSQIRKLIGDR